jgi:RND family efflux transporter MFP subunit
LTITLWRQYMLAPWTRDGRVRAEVVDVAPEIAGTVVAVAVSDNQFVRKGDLLFQIDPSRYRFAAARAEADVEQRRQDLKLKLGEASRRSGMAGIVSSEDIDRHRGVSDEALAALHAAEAALNLARLDLERTTLRAPANGYVTNLRLRAGDYVSPGATRVAVIDSDSFWIAGYFEETKLSRIHVGDAAKIKLMGFKAPLDGHVESIGRGIADANDRADIRGLPDVNPIFTWVRLAQRIPIRFHIDHIPEHTLLAAGMTCSISVGSEAAESDAGYLPHVSALLRETLRSWKS